jgi:hypothetical protein
LNELAKIDKRGECSKKQDRINRSAGSGRGHQQWNRFSKNSVKSRLRVKKIKGPKIRGAGSAGRREDGCHFVRQDRKDSESGSSSSSSSSSSRAKCKELDLGSSEQGEAIQGMVQHDVDGGGSSKSSLGIIIHGGDVRGSDKSSSSHGAGGGGFAGGSKIKFLSSSLSGGRDKRALPPSTALGWMSQNSNEWLGK